MKCSKRRKYFWRKAQWYSHFSFSGYRLWANSRQSLGWSRLSSQHTYYRTKSHDRYHAHWTRQHRGTRKRKVILVNCSKYRTRREEPELCVENLEPRDLRLKSSLKSQFIEVSQAAKFSQIYFSELLLSDKFIKSSWAFNVRNLFRKI